MTQVSAAWHWAKLTNTSLSWDVLSMVQLSHQPKLLQKSCLKHSGVSTYSMLSCRGFPCKKRCWCLLSRGAEVEFLTIPIIFSPSLKLAWHCQKLRLQVEPAFWEGVGALPCSLKQVLEWVLWQVTKPPTSTLPLLLFWSWACVIGVRVSLQHHSQMSHYPNSPLIALLSHQDHDLK